jgi:hypothetical protein
MMTGKYNKAIDAAKRLVNNYPAHEYSINNVEAKYTLKLTIKDLNKLKIWQELKKKFDELSEKDYIIQFAELDIPEQQVLQTPTQSLNNEKNEPDILPKT